MKVFAIHGKVWKYEGPAGWYFVYVDKKISEKLREEKSAKRVAWGYIQIRAKVGKTSWDTTVFPTKEGPYLLAIKASVRKKEGIDEGDTVRVACTLL
ncbi:DUF1905 domain-containing protein [Candidatus Parcubacteria bacterium]|nr:MAG: DUF1905 domain-containing protein [Candidatus Parcubacteria bacterium]